MEYRSLNYDLPPAEEIPVDRVTIVRDQAGTSRLYYNEGNGALRLIPQHVASRMLEVLRQRAETSQFTIGTESNRVNTRRIVHTRQSRARTPMHTRAMANPPAEERPLQSDAERNLITDGIAVPIRSAPAPTFIGTSILVPRSGTPPPPPVGSTGLDTSRGTDTDRVARERREVQRAMAEARETDENRPARYTVPYNGAYYSVPAQSQPPQYNPPLSEQSPPGEAEDLSIQSSVLIMTPTRQAPDSLMAMINLRTNLPGSLPSATATPLRDQSPPGAPRADRRRLPETSVWASSGTPRQRPYTPGDRQRVQGTNLANRERDIQFVASQAGVTTDNSRLALERSNWDPVAAIIEAMGSPQEGAPVTPSQPLRERMEYSPLAVPVRREVTGDGTVSQALTRQTMLDARRKRLKKPCKDFMSIADDVQDEISNGAYLRMANACKKMYEVIEELDPTSVEGYNVVGEGTQIETHAERIAELEEQLQERDDALDRIQDQLRAKTRELHKLNSMQAAIMRNEQAAINKWEAHRNVIKALEGHSVIGTHVAFSKAMTSIALGTDLLKHGDSNLARKWKALRSGVWNRRSFEIESVKYEKTDYTEGFGALGFSLDEENALWNLWGPDAE